MQKGASLSVSQYFSTWQGRSFQMTEGMLSFVPEPRWMLWYARQDTTARGRNSSNRFDLQADTFGVRGVVREATSAVPRAWAVQLELFHPSEGVSQTGSTTAVFRGTRNVSVAAIMSDPVADYRLGYTSVRGAASGSADVIDFGYGRTLQVGERLEARLQGSAILQRFESSTDAKLALYGNLNYRVSPNVSLQAEATVLPFGVPMAHGRLTPMSSFFVYRPGGTVEGLRESFVVVGALRLVLDFRF